MPQRIKQVVYLLAVIFCLTPWASAPIALALGLVLAVVGLTAWEPQSRKASRLLIQICIVFLGLTISLSQVAEAGQTGILFATGTILCTFSLGWLLGIILRTERNVTTLLCTGTAICGGSAIAATAAVIRASAAQMSVALAAVFILNAIGIYCFPVIGHAMELSQKQFGTWAAIALHDGSSVVATAKTYGDEALDRATVIKLCRVIWLVPVSIFAAWLAARGSAEAPTPGAPTRPAGKLRQLVPWFIAAFIMASVVRTFVPQLSEPLFQISWGSQSIHSLEDIFKTLAKQGMVVALFLIGAGLSKSAVMHVGWRPFALATILWVIICAAALCFVKLTFT
jgi:uncharacterized integral membrane protein (TIGR00698 family)